MINILETSRELDEVEQYLMTQNPGIHILKNEPDGTSIPVLAWTIFEDVKDDTGEVAKLLSVMTPEMEVYTCQSQTFTKNFLQICKLMKDKSFAVVKQSGQTKAGRDFITCVLDVKYVREKNN